MLPFKKVVIPIVAITTLLLSVIWLAGAFTEKIPPGQNKPSSISNTDTVSVVEKEIQLYEFVPASIQAKQATSISARLLSQIRKIHVRAGTSVKRGQLLIELDKDDLLSRASQAKSAENSVHINLQEAKKTLDRAKELSKSGVLAKADLDRAQANHDSLQANLVSAKQALRETETALGFADIYAPIDGRIIDRFAEPGDMAQPGQRLLSLYNPLSLRIEAHVRENLAVSLQAGQVLEVDVPAINQQMRASVEEIVPAGNAGSRSFLIKSRIPHTENMMPGMYARLKIPAGTKRLLLVPSDRVARVGQLDVVWLLSGQNTERRFIRTGKVVEQGLIEVISGLEAGEQLLPGPNRPLN